MNALLVALYSFCKAAGLSKTYWIAYSGGLDSSVLLALCHTLAATHPIAFRIIHIDHGLQATSKEWALFARERAIFYGFPYEERVVTSKRQAGESLEAYARKARYALFQEVIETGDILLTAHHQDDQAETVLLQLMRGAGVKGLSAMSSMRPLGHGLLGRPLLSFSREVLRAFAEKEKLSWMEDTSNTNTLLARNYLRHEVMPRLKERWPKTTELLARSAAHCATAQSMIDDYIDLHEVSGVSDGALSVNKLLCLPEKIRLTVLRRWIMQAGYYPPDQKKLFTIQTSVLKSRWDKTPSVTLEDDIALRRYRDDLHLVKLSSLNLLNKPYDEIIWHLHESSECVIPMIGCLEAQLASEGGGKEGGIIPHDVASLNVRFVPSSETIAVMGRGRRHSVKNLFQEWGVPPWMRRCTPLLFLKDELVGVPGYYWTSRWQNNQTDCAKFKIIFRINS